MRWHKTAGLMGLGVILLVIGLRLLSHPAHSVGRSAGDGNPAGAEGRADASAGLPVEQTAPEDANRAAETSRAPASRPLETRSDLPSAPAVPADAVPAETARGQDHGPQESAAAAADPDSGLSDQEQMARLLEQLAGAEKGERFDELMRQLASFGEQAVALIGQQLQARTQSFAWEQRAAGVLAAIGSPQAQAVLRALALGATGQDNPNLHAWAAQCLLQVTSDPREAQRLLASPEPQVDGMVIRAWKGRPLDPELFAELERHLRADDPTVRWATAATLAAEPTGRFSASTARAIGRALQGVSELPHHDEWEPSSHMGTSLTVGEANYLRYIYALTQMKDAAPALRGVTAELDGRARDAAVVARALRGDDSVHPQVTGLIQDPKAGMFRAWAAQSLGQIGSDDDLSLLRKIAESDPLQREGALRAGPPGQRGLTFPVREAAADAIRQIEQRKSRQG